MTAIIFMTYKQIKLNHSHAFLQSAETDYFVERETKDEKRKKVRRKRQDPETNSG
ncbi:MAG: hypothetical protein WBG58_02950 [Ignavibacteriaceae bacterium]